MRGHKYFLLSSEANGNSILRSTSSFSFVYFVQFFLLLFKHDSCVVFDSVFIELIAEVYCCFHVHFVLLDLLFECVFLPLYLTVLDMLEVIKCQPIKNLQQTAHESAR